MNYSAERFTRRNPANIDIDTTALEFIRTKPEVVVDVLTKYDAILAAERELPKIDALPADLATVETALLEMQKTYFENSTVACIARLGHYMANRQAMDWKAIVADRHLPQIVLSLIDPEIIRESVRRLRDLEFNKSTDSPLIARYIDRPFFDPCYAGKHFF